MVETESALEEWEDIDRDRLRRGERVGLLSLILRGDLPRSFSFLASISSASPFLWPVSGTVSLHGPGHLLW